MPEGVPLLETSVRTVEHRNSSRAGLRCVQFPLSSTESISEDLGLSPELLASWALRRAHRGGVSTSGDHYLDHGRVRLSYLTRTFDELAEAGLLALAEENPWGLRRVSLTDAGTARYEQLCQQRQRALQGSAPG